MTKAGTSWAATMSYLADLLTLLLLSTLTFALSESEIFFVLLLSFCMTEGDLVELFFDLVELFLYVYPFFKLFSSLASKLIPVSPLLS